MNTTLLKTTIGTQRMLSTQQQASYQMMQFITARWISEPIYIVAKLGIADILAEKTKSIKDIAQQTNTFKPYLYRVMRALSSAGIFKEEKNKRFKNTPLSECLKKDSMRATALFFLSDWHKKAWDNLFQSIKTGETAFELAHGKPAFEWLGNHPDEATIFNQANTSKIRNSHKFFINSYDFLTIKSITDIGGGTGVLMIEILKANPHMQGIIADLPYLSEQAAKYINKQGFQGKCKFVSCDFFNEVPEGESYILCNVLHDWDDDRCKTILNNIHKKMKNMAKLLIMEMIVPPENESSLSKLLDLEVLVMGGGGERTLNEYNQLFKSTGFRINKIINTEANDQIIECICE